MLNIPFNSDFVTPTAPPIAAPTGPPISKPVSMSVAIPFASSVIAEMPPPIFLIVSEPVNSPISWNSFPNVPKALAKAVSSEQNACMFSGVKPPLLNVFFSVLPNLVIAGSALSAASPNLRISSVISFCSSSLSFSDANWSAVMPNSFPFASSYLPLCIHASNSAASFFTFRSCATVLLAVSSYSATMTFAFFLTKSTSSSPNASSPFAFAIFRSPSFCALAISRCI